MEKQDKERRRGKWRNRTKREGEKRRKRNRTRRGGGDDDDDVTTRIMGQREAYVETKPCHRKTP